ncbi:MAG: MlaD family protein [Myxococcota bacterium]
MDAERRVQLRAGFFTLAVLVAGATAVLLLSQQGGLFSPRYTLYAEFTNIEGLTVNAPVHLAGNNVGRVRSIEFLQPGAPRPIRVAMELDASVQSRIRSDSTALIGTIGLLGDKYVEISIGTLDAPGLPPGSRIQTQEAATFSELASKGRALLDNLVQLTSTADRIAETFDREMGSESLARLIAAMDRLVRSVEEEDGLVHALFYDESGAEVIRELRGTAEGLRSLVEEVQNGHGVLHGLVYSEKGQEPALARLNSILAKIDRGDGTVGALINDPTLYEDLKQVFGGASQSALVRGLVEFVRERDTK